ncbi:DNA-processing protein DprA [Marinobacterium sediminicola]|uniref:DNA processing protein n=1 Tax=Marinobacterium sediminicola TaxID=518898 RepID=A0ABY1S3F7_9GAMM|nr:DNA-processing protein DprA [Marinobacterium sediminicola]ULG69251.1 DNA-processing protein DprA [Marinobacterium sediminicola]SMR77599.1 DNA processing protein [Marinobacterium sediminicola]
MCDPKEWIAASLLPGVGPVTLARLRQDGVDLPRLLRGEISLPQGIRLRSDTLSAVHDYQSRGELYARTERLLEYAEQQQFHLLSLSDPNYPELLQQIPDPPVLLWVRGDAGVLSMPQLAVVGSRKASRAGCRLAYEFSSTLSASGLLPVSGLALGVDAAVHQACVDRQAPTLAVVGTGLDRVYPHRNQALAAGIVEQGGAIVSEYPPGTAPLPGNFPRRNRIISGLAVGTLVVEAAPRSGSLITARQALEQGREVFAIPGSIHNPLSRGCHALIREGATLVEEVGQIIEQLGPMLGALVPSDMDQKPDIQHEVADNNPLLAQIPFDSIWLDQLATELQLPMAQLQSGLMLLELDGHIEISGSRVRRTR